MKQPKKQKSNDSLKLYKLGERINKLAKARVGQPIDKQNSLSKEIDSLIDEARKLQASSGILPKSSYATNDHITDKYVHQKNPDDIKAYAGLPAYYEPTNKTTGDKSKLIKVKSKNDPRYKAYQDSLHNYNLSQKYLKEAKGKGFKKVETPKGKLPQGDSPRDRINRRLHFSKDALSSPEEAVGFLKKNGFKANYPFDKDKTVHHPTDVYYSHNIDDTGTLARLGDMAGVISSAFGSGYESKIKDTAYSVPIMAKPNQKVIVEEDNLPNQFKKVISEMPKPKPRPKEKGLTFNSKGVKSHTPEVIEDTPKFKTQIEKIPYNISTKRDHKTIDGKQYGMHKGELKEIQTREEYRKKNLRPNGTPYPESMADGGLITNNTTMRKKRLKSKKATPKAFWGALLSTGVSLVSGLVAQNKEQKALEENDARNASLMKASERSVDQARLQGYNYEGNNVTDYYMAKGGKLANPAYKAKGGDLIPMSSDSVVAKGNKHEESTIDNTSGIKLYNGGQDPVVEIEDEEVIKDDTQVYSDRLKAPNGITYADNMKKLSKEKGKIEKEGKNVTGIRANTNKRKLAGIEQKEQALFMHQEMNKPVESQPTKAYYGADLTKKLKEEKANYDMPEDTTMSKVAPYMDNVVNAALTLNTPKIPKARTQNVVPLKTEYNANPQLNAVRNSVNAASETIKRNTSDSNVARNSITAAKLAGARQTSSILADKENKEVQMQNASIANAQNIHARNIHALNANDYANMDRANTIQSEISANVKNVGEDIIDYRNYKGTQRYNKERLDIARQMYQSDTTRRAMLNNPSEIQLLKQDPEYAKEILDVFKGTREEEQLRKLLGIPRVTTVGVPSSKGLANIN